MYRYGDGTPFPLDENFIETLTAAIESCTNAFMPLTELDERRNRAKAARGEADRRARPARGPREVARLRARAVHGPRQEERAGQPGRAEDAARREAADPRLEGVRSRVACPALEAQASASTSSEAVMQALRPFFDHNQLPTAKWIMSWDVRGDEPSADAVIRSRPVDRELPTCRRSVSPADPSRPARRRRRRPHDERRACSAKRSRHLSISAST